MVTAVCPYCGNDSFVGSTTAIREGTRLWENECTNTSCGLWSVNDDTTGTQSELADPTDRTSARSA